MIQNYNQYNTELKIPQLAMRTNHFDVELLLTRCLRTLRARRARRALVRVNVERFASCVFCGGHTVFCVVVVTKVEDSYLLFNL